MVLHKGKQVQMRSIGAVRNTTLCGRMNRNSVDGMNIADSDAEVTCKFCRKMMEASAIRSGGAS